MKKRTKNKAMGESDCAKNRWPAPHTEHARWPEWALDAYREGCPECVPTSHANLRRTVARTKARRAA